MAQSRSQKTGFAGALFAGLALLLATSGAPAWADGSSGSGGAFKIVGASYAQELEYASCMRRHGEPDFPDPSSSGGGISFSLRGIDPNSPQFQRANGACRSLSPLPGGGPGAP